MICGERTVTYQNQKKMFSLEKVRNVPALLRPLHNAPVSLLQPFHLVCKHFEKKNSHGFSQMSRDTSNDVKGSTRPILFIDNGGSTIKAALLRPYHPRSSSQGEYGEEESVQFLAIPNCVGAASYAGRGLVGAHVLQLPHYHGFVVRRPVDRCGFIADAELQLYIWEYILQQLSIHDEEQVELMLTVPFGAPREVAQLLQYLTQNRLRFHAVTLVSSTFLALIARDQASWLEGRSIQEPRQHVASRTRRGTGIVVDVGFSSSTVVPYVDYRPVTSSMLRMDVGGKILANRLKEIISFSQINLTEDGWLVNCIKESSCFTSLRPLEALRIWQERKQNRGPSSSAATARKDELVQITLRRAKALRDGKQANTSSFNEDASDSAPPDACEHLYFLPTVPSLMPLGRAGNDLQELAGLDALTPSLIQSVVLRHEAFLIPELLFRPQDVGIQQPGVALATAVSIFHRGLLKKTPFLTDILVSGTVLFGGSTKFPSFEARFSQECQSLLESTREANPTMNGKRLRSTVTHSHSFHPSYRARRCAALPPDSYIAEPEPSRDPLRKNQRAERKRCLTESPVATQECESALPTEPSSTSKMIRRDAPKAKGNPGTLHLDTRELQPLFGAISLIQSPHCADLRELLRTRSRLCTREMVSTTEFQAQKRSTHSKRETLREDEQVAVFRCILENLL